MNISGKAKDIADNCRFCWMCRHVCPVGNATGQERNTARARALAVSLTERGAEKLEEIVDNVYECMLCGACTNNCVTGYDPRAFIREVRTEAVLNGKMPPYIERMFRAYGSKGNVYGREYPEELLPYAGEEDTLFFAGTDAICKSPKSVAKAAELLRRGGVRASLNKEPDSGAELYFLLGKTEETRQAMTKCAEALNRYRTVVVYDPVDLSLFLHEYREWGVGLTAKVVGFHALLLNLVKEGGLKPKKSEREYTVQDHYAYARELDDVQTVRELVDRVGKRRELLLNGKEANCAGSLIMNEYMPDAMRKIAEERWREAERTGCGTLVTENPAEYELLKGTAPQGSRVLTVEEMLLENL